MLEMIYYNDLNLSNFGGCILVIVVVGGEGGGGGWGLVSHPKLVPESPIIIRVNV